MDECGLAAGEVVGWDSIKALSRMNSAVVMFLDSIDKVNILVERGIVMRNTQTAVFPLNNPSKKVILSNLPPFVKSSRKGTVPSWAACVGYKGDVIGLEIA